MILRNAKRRVDGCINPFFRHVELHASNTNRDSPGTVGRDEISKYQSSKSPCPTSRCRDWSVHTHLGRENGNCSLIGFTKARLPPRRETMAQKSGMLEAERAREKSEVKWAELPERFPHIIH
ncbi:hypothetical protein J6590_037320 [Homalodisca vitripennis]|nr:hypothetical protein J6590_037320 [Homalodisca vitripennis]